ncbi:hypothetical protein AK812_SmicGene39106 [Symbiodinium microadriaticum]|uniref:Uncharacterized protein n=1 Tax=Symbiodinium microadriaticum TaxID=2951 RepID=A0A1Q9CC27_SYMMI|nr:hypothetical protein AK812_SmicGene39106 [Symbiodinium microadriaticum]
MHNASDEHQTFRVNVFFFMSLGCLALKGGPQVDMTRTGPRQTLSDGRDAKDLCVVTHYVRRQYGIECVWDGDAAAYPDFMRRVRLAFERTPRKKKHLLGPEVVAQLTGRAWVITQDLSHRLLVKRNGVIYLLEYVRDRLGRTRLRSKVLQEACFDKRIDLISALAAYHETIADVDREVGYVRKHLETFLRYARPGQAAQGAPAACDLAYLTSLASEEAILMDSIGVRCGASEACEAALTADCVASS